MKKRQKLKKTCVYEYASNDRTRQNSLTRRQRLSEAQKHQKIVARRFKFVFHSRNCPLGTQKDQ